ncbi:MAG TPA: acyltransferase [bacterium]|nr:acyltransferase [bacterium]
MENLKGFRKAGSDVVIWPEAKIVGRDTITLGDSIVIDDFVFIVGGENTDIGSFIHIASFVSITGGGEFVIEDFSNIATGSRLLTGTDDFLGNAMIGPTVPNQYRKITRSQIHIKKHVILGANTVVLPGVTIGEGVAVGANSLIVRDCEPWTVYTGSPARAVKPRKKETILQYEAELKSKVYDKAGNYILKKDWKL